MLKGRHPGFCENAGAIFAMVFALGLFVRCAINLVFKIRFGLKAVNHIEIWHYVGLMDPDIPVLLQHGESDPTLWILRQIGAALPEWAHLHAVELFSAVLISLAAALISQIAYRLWGASAGLLAGLGYATMVQPIGLSVSGFTHDHIQLPLVALCVYLAVRASQSGFFSAFLFSAAFVAFYKTANNVNDTINVAAVAAAIYVGYIVWSLVFERLSKSWGLVKNIKTRGWIIYLFLLALALAYSSALVIPDLLGQQLDGLPQGRTGSEDVRPISLDNAFIRYNALLLILPVLLAAGAGYRDPLGLSLIGLGVALSFQMDRGTRILDIGMALSFGLAMSRVPAKPVIFGRKIVLWKYAVVWALASHLALSRLTHNSFLFEAIYLLGGMALAGCLYFTKKERVFAAAAVMAVLGSSASMAYVMTVPGRMIVSDTEYRIWDWLSKNDSCGRVLAGWDRGLMIRSVSKLEPVSSAAKINRRTHSYLWMPHMQAGRMLAEDGVSHVMVTSENFNIVRFDGELAYRVVGGLLFHDEYVPDISQAQRYAIYGLRHNQTVGGFRLVKSGFDSRADMSYLLYEVTARGQGPRIGAIAHNRGGAREAVVLASDARLSKGVFERRYEVLGIESFEAGQIREIDYPMPFEDSRVCQMRTQPMPLQSIGGSLAFENLGPERTVDIRLALVSAGDVVAKYNHSVHMKSKQKASFEFFWDDMDPFKRYELRMASAEDIRIIQERSWGPESLGVDFIEVFC